LIILSAHLCDFRIKPEKEDYAIKESVRIEEFMHSMR
jgi:hypothetical protein